MKRQICTKLVLTALGLSLVSLSSVAAQTIYGLQNASQLRSNSSGDFYIQVASFKSKSNALRAKSALQRKSDSSIAIRERSGYYTVVIGPIHSAAAVRTTAAKLGAGSALTHVATTKLKTASRAPYSQPVALKHTPPTYSPQVSKTIQKAPVQKVYKDKDGFPLGPTNRWFVGLGVGWMFPFGTDESSFASSGIPDFPDDRYSADHSKSAGQYSAFAGYQWRRATDWLPAYSLAAQYTYTDSARIDGFIYVNDLPDTRNFKYRYDISQQLIMAKLKLDLYRWRQLMPYVSGGAGVAINRVHGYSEYPIPGETTWEKNYGFTSGNRTQFAGSVGAGFDFEFNDRAQVSLGYELAYYGKVRTGKGEGVLSADRLENKLNSNAVVLQGTYFFDW
ncbi:Opacity protein antigens [Legionella massiliensis]|uniref:Opacity protein antigens n=1 Tax=Legionella massiliensis TaxID=1034943 RepID=A0A078KNT1_9GAMM|nr:SPOR domain-containing protein [Legionella massiliensis]CDZ76010.1 Opacity protein antigens [Legionella massiliensis]CEE11748.1 Sporulation related domain protein [Legionella massiliensis]